MDGKQERGWQFLQPPTKREARWKWTGFAGKTLWDWMQLLSALAIPAVIAIGTLWFTARQNATQRYIEDQRAQDAALQAYFDQMGQLLLDKDRPLRLSDEGSEERMLARARTLAVLGRLDEYRKRSVLLFLHDSALINREGESSLAEDNTNPVVNLATADLRGANLGGFNLVGVPTRDVAAVVSKEGLLSPKVPGVDLSEANLSGANLRGTYLLNADLARTDLSDADLTNANLTNANLKEADLTGADLSDADLTGAEGINEEKLKLQVSSLEGATMPDGGVSSAEEPAGDTTPQATTADTVPPRDTATERPPSDRRPEDTAPPRGAWEQDVPEP
jgi:uncharacterized protein YjbI with pentapeptide repeats